MAKTLALCLILLLTTIAWAGVTGKIAGVITDSETGQPVPGVNIMLMGTTLGTVTNIDGQFIILNVPVGAYHLRASIVGYANVMVEDVKVSMDITTTVNFGIEPQVLQVSEGVTIVAQRPMIQKDEVSTRHFITSEEIDMQPIDNFQQIAQNQAGVVGSHFRGGRAGEVLVLIDGIPVKDPAGAYSDNLAHFTSSVPEYSIQEIEVSLGGFSAEYGNVQSGILNLALKEGASRYSGKARFSSTNFGSPDLNTNLLKQIYEINLNGPEPLTTHLLPGIGLKVPGSLGMTFSAEITDKSRGYYLNQNSFDQTYQGKLIYRMAPNHRLTYGGVVNKGEWDKYYFPASKYGPAPDYPANEYRFVEDSTLYHYVYVKDPTKYQQGLVEPKQGTFQNTPYKRVATFYPAGMQEYLNNYSKNSNMHYLIWTHTLSPKMFYEIRLQRFYTNSHYATPDVDDRDGDGNTEEDLVWDINKSGPHPTYREREINYWWVRGDDPAYRDQSSWTTSAKADFITQVTANHLLKTGIELYHHRTKVENISWTLNLGSVRKDIWDEDSYDFGVYFQDKLEFEGIIALIGLRYDYFNPNGFGGDIYMPADYMFPYSQLDENNLPIFIDPKKASTKQQLSPRIGISHPITDRDVIHFTYGHYFQRPDGYYIYRNYKFQSLTKAGNYIGNPNLKPEKTVAYEIGLEHQFTNDIKGTITGYYKDVTNLMDWMKYVGRSIQNIELNVFTNADYGNIKGLEFTLKKRTGRYWGVSANYTYSIAKGRNSDPWGGYGSFTDAKRMNIMDFDQTHTVNANVILRTPSDVGLRIGSWRPFASWQANFQFKYGSGLPYSSFGTGKVNDQRLPWTANTDVKLLRQFKWSRIVFEVFMDVFNLFDRTNLAWLGSSQYYQITGDPSIVTRDDVTGVYIRNPQVYNYGRQVRFGLAVQF